MILAALALAGAKLSAQTTITVIATPGWEAPQPFPVGDHIVATTTITLRALTGLYAAPPPPAAITVLPKTTVVLTTSVPADKIASITWYKDSRKLAGVTTPSLTLAAATNDDAGFYSVQIARTDDPPFRYLYDGAFETLHLLVGAPDDHKFRNLSSRTILSPANPTLISGLVIAPRPSAPLAAKKVLFRAVGPSLTKFGVAHPLARPQLRIFRQDGSAYDLTYAYPQVILGPWVDPIADATARTGAFPLVADAADAVDLRPMLPGVYTVHVTSADAGTGDVLLEIYEVPDDAWPAPIPTDVPPPELPPVSPTARLSPPR